LIKFLQDLNDIGVPTRSQGNISHQIYGGEYHGTVVVTDRYGHFEIRWYPEDNILSLHITYASHVSHVFMKHLIELRTMVDLYNAESEALNDYDYYDFGC